MACGVSSPVCPGSAGPRLRGSHSLVRRHRDSELPLQGAKNSLELHVRLEEQQVAAVSKPTFQHGKHL